MVSRPLVLDGGLGSELKARGRFFSGSRWSASLLESAGDLALLRDVHASFFRAGSDVATTASYALGADGDDLELCARSVKCAREALESCGDKRDTGRVMGSLGSYGATLPGAQEFSGTYVDTTPNAREVFTTHHAEKARALVAAGADCLVVETLPRAEEALWFAEWVRSSGSGIGVPIAFSFTVVGSGTASGSSSGANSGSISGPVSGSGSDAISVRTAGGSCLATAAQGVADLVPVSQLMALGVNCCDPRIVSEALSLVPQGVPRIAYANSGEGWDAEKSEWINETALSVEEYAETAAGWAVNDGAIAVGGCCRIGPDHIRAICAAIDRSIVSRGV